MRNFIKITKQGAHHSWFFSLEENKCISDGGVIGRYSKVDNLMIGQSECGRCGIPGKARKSMSDVLCCVLGATFGPRGSIACAGPPCDIFTASLCFTKQLVYRRAVRILLMVLCCPDSRVLRLDFACVCSQMSSKKRERER